MRRGKRSTTRVERQRKIKKRMRMRRRRKRQRKRGRRMKRCRRKRTISKMMDSTCSGLKAAVRIERILTM